MIASLFSISGIVLASSTFLLCFIILLLGRTKLHRIWLALNFVVGLWGIGAFFIGKIETPENALMVWRIVHIPIAFIPVFCYHVIYELCELKERNILVFAYTQSAIFSILSLFSIQFIPSVRWVFDSFYFANGGPLFYVFVLFWFFFVGYSHYKLFQSYLTAKGQLKTQILYFFFATIVGFLGGATNFFPTFGIDIYPFGNFTIPLYCFIVTYAILKHQLLDLKVVLTNTTIYGLFCTVILGVPIINLTILGGTWIAKVNLFSVGGLVLAISTFILSIVLMVYGRTKLHQIWLIFNLVVGLWGLGAFYIGGIETAEIALLTWRLVFLAIIFIPVLNYHVIYELCKLNERKIFIFVYVQAIVFSYLSLFSSNFIPNVRFVFNDYFYDQAGPIFWIFLPIWFSIVSYSCIRLFLVFLKSRGRLRTQILYFFLGTVVGFLGGATNFLPALGIDFYPFGNFTIPLYCFIVSYAIIRHHLLDITVTMTRAGVFIGVYTFILGIPFGLAFFGRDWLLAVLGDGWFWIPMTSLLLLATVGPFIYFYIQRRAENALLQEENRIQELLTKASYGMTTIHNQEKLCNVILTILKKTLRIKMASMYVLNPDIKAYVLIGDHQNEDINSQNEKKVEDKDAIINFIQKRQYPVVFDEVRLEVESSQDVKLKQIQHWMEQLQASLIVPIMMNHQLLGFIVLGQREAKEMYSMGLLNVLSVLGNQVALAIENCRFWEKETRRIEEESFQQRIKSLDMMASSFAHEIDNPMAIVLGQMDFVQEYLEYQKDIVPDQVKTTITDSFVQMRKAGLRVSGMIKAILDYSRIGKGGKLAPINIKDAVDDFLSLIMPQMKKQSVYLQTEISKDLPLILGDKIQLEELLMNFAMNAIHAVRGNSDKQIHIKVFKKDDHKIRIEFTDNGYGIPSKIIKDIFLASVTTKASSESTGLGLFRVRKIVDIHQGDIWAESEGAGKGATMIVELPIFKGEVNQVLENSHG